MRGVCDRMGRGWGYVGKERQTRDDGNGQTPKSSSIESQPLPNLQRCSTCDATPAPACARLQSVLLRWLATIRSSQGPFASLGPLFRSELPMERANLLVPQCLFLTHSLAPLAVFPDLHPSRTRAAQLVFSLSRRTRTRTVRCAVRYLVYIPYLSPRLSCPPACHLSWLHLSASSTQGPGFVSSGRSPSCLVLSCPV